MTGSLKLQAKREKSIKSLLDCFHFSYPRLFRQSPVPTSSTLSPVHTFPSEIVRFYNKGCLLSTVFQSIFSPFSFWSSRSIGNQMILKYNLFAPPTRSCPRVYPGFCAANFPFPFQSMIERVNILFCHQCWDDIWVCGNEELIKSTL